MRRKRLLISDIDGVAVDSSERFHRYTDWEALARGDYARLRECYLEAAATTQGDRPIPTGLMLLSGLMRVNPDLSFAWVTSRCEEGRAPTVQYLDGYVHPRINVVHAGRGWSGYWTECPGPGIWKRTYRHDYLDSEQELFLCMRDAECGPAVAPEVLKERHLDWFLAQGYEVVLAVEDHPDIVAMYRRRGIPSLLVDFPGIDCLTAQGWTEAAAKVAAL